MLLFIIFHLIYAIIVNRSVKGYSKKTRIPLVPSSMDLAGHCALGEGNGAGREQAARLPREGAGRRMPRAGTVLHYILYSTII